MKPTSTVCGIVTWVSSLITAGLALMVSPTVLSADIHLDMLKTRTDVFTNVTVYGRSKTDIFIRHAWGIANIKIESLDPQTLAQLNGNGAATSASSATGAYENEPSAAESATTASAASLKFKAQQQMVLARLAALKSLAATRVSSTMVGVVLCLVVVFYLFFCYCLRLICLKTGNNPGILIWLPILQMFPLLRAAGMSGWWFLGLFVPVVNLVVQIIWCFKIVQARGKSVLAAIGLLFPVTNLISLLYLAFSDGRSAETDGEGKLSITAPLPSEA